MMSDKIIGADGSGPERDDHAQVILHKNQFTVSVRLQAAAARLDAVIARNLEHLGYGGGGT